MNMGPCYVIMGQRNVNTGLWNENWRPCNVIMGPWNVNWGPWNVIMGRVIWLWERGI